MSQEKSSYDSKRDTTNLCICGHRPNEVSSISLGEYYILAAIVSFFVIGSIFVEPKVAGGIIVAIFAVGILLTALRRLVGHSWKCSLRWAALAPLSILQYV